ncbi:hypothetical protein SEPCBS119000_005613 [Sporothrix epigloea]|uniref:Acetylserotonin methytransferase-like protein n=1 Tax=Sporothrix epigloea TaxID=1892477 RepID=A0ABP0E0G2_9PEZI
MADRQASGSPTSLQPLPATPQLMPSPQRPEVVRNDSVRSRSSIAKVRLSLYDDSPPSDDEPLPPMPGGSLSVAGQSTLQRQHRPPALRSIFPQYNPDLPLDEQDYYPTQTSPTRIPRNVISRPLYSPVGRGLEEQPDEEVVDSLDAVSNQEAPAAVRTVPSSSLDKSALYSGPVAMPHSKASDLPVPSSSDDLRNLWRVASGWKAGASEGRSYCMKLSCERDAPVYWLSSSSNRPFYRLRVDPTSTSAFVTLARHDPGRPFKPDTTATKSDTGAITAGAGLINSPTTSLSRADCDGADSSVAGEALVDSAAVASAASAATTGDKNWQVAISTTLQEDSRRHHPQDGLVALLYPAAAARVALARPLDMAMVAAAERECARLVWDDDSGAYFLVHPVLALPFTVTIERSTAWSRTVYTLEHRESPQHLARLTRDGTGAGYLEVDTGIASQIEAAYLVDVVVLALLLVAYSDDRVTATTSFAPPPDRRHHGNLANSAQIAGSTAQSNTQDGSGGSDSRCDGQWSKTKGRRRGRAYFGRKRPKVARFDQRHMEPFDLDIESQTNIDLTAKGFELTSMSSDNTNSATDSGREVPGKKRRSKKEPDKDKMPGCLRLITALFKCVFWCLTIVARAAIVILNSLFRCLTSEKLV